MLLPNVLGAHFFVATVYSHEAVYIFIMQHEFLLVNLFVICHQCLSIVAELTHNSGSEFHLLLLSVHFLTLSVNCFLNNKIIYLRWFMYLL